MIIGYLVIASVTIFFINSRAITQVLLKTVWPNLTYVTSFKKCIFNTSFYEIQSSGYKVMDLNGRTEKWMNGRTDRRTAEHVPNYIPPHLAGDN